MATPNVASVKILTVGSAVGSIREIFAKIDGINAKHGKFDVVLCIGDFFGPVDGDGATDNPEVAQLLNGDIVAPLTCYVMQGERALPYPVIEKFASTQGEIAKNVFLLGKSGIVTTPHGLKIACLGGAYDAQTYAQAESPHGFTSPYFTKHTIEKLNSSSMINSASEPQNFSSLAAIRAAASTSSLVDVMISNVWPEPITQFSDVALPSPELASICVQPAGDLVKTTKPRYFIAAGGGKPPMFWEREPFVWDDEQGRISRFISLGAFGGEQPASGKKQRWFYAFSINPSASAPTPRPNNATKNPFTEFVQRVQKRPLDMNEGQNFRWGNQKAPAKRTRTGDPGKPPPGYKCKRCEGNDHFITDCPERAKPPEGYICKICSTPGHFVRDCPTKHTPGDTGGKKPKEGYVCRACGGTEHYLEDCLVAQQGRTERPRRDPMKEIAPDECWFCLSNPAIAKHLIVAIGNECYVTLSKGQIPPTKTAGDYPNTTHVPGGGHILIVPIGHYQTIQSITPDLAQGINAEINKYKIALHNFYAKHGAAMVSFEVGRVSAKGGHAHVQVVPVPHPLADKVEGAFVEEGRRIGLEPESDPQAALKACADGKKSYFRVDLPDGREVVWLIDNAGRSFSLQFGRIVLTSLLGMKDRLDWKACSQSDEDDTLDAQIFKTAFAPFDDSSE